MRAADRPRRSVEEFARYLGYVPALLGGDASWLRLDLSIVRGLAYYTGIVFELFDRSGEFRAICGGGRYDTLLESLGGADMPALGFGMGDVVLGELLRAKGLMTPAEQRAPTTGWRRTRSSRCERVMAEAARRRRPRDVGGVRAASAVAEQAEEGRAGERRQGIRDTLERRRTNG